MSDELPDINVTRGEKALAFVLAVFLLVGGLWVYFEPLTREAGETHATPQQRVALDASQRANAAEGTAEAKLNTVQEAYDEAREDYRTDLDARSSTKITKPRFEQARRDLDAAKQRAATAKAQAQRTAVAGTRAQEALYQAQDDASRRA